MVYKYIRKTKPLHREILQYAPHIKRLHYSFGHLSIRENGFRHVSTGTRLLSLALFHRFWNTKSRFQGLYTDIYCLIF